MIDARAMILTIDRTQKSAQTLLFGLRGINDEGDGIPKERQTIPISVMFLRSSFGARGSYIALWNTGLTQRCKGSAAWPKQRPNSILQSDCRI